MIIKVNKICSLCISHLSHRKTKNKNLWSIFEHSLTESRSLRTANFKSMFTDLSVRDELLVIRFRRHLFPWCGKRKRSKHAKRRRVNSVTGSHTSRGMSGTTTPRYTSLTSLYHLQIVTGKSQPITEPGEGRVVGRVPSSHQC